MYTPDKIILQMLRSKDLADGDSHSIGRYFDDGYAPKLPESELLEYGEIALNIAKKHEVIAIKNYDGDVVCIPFDIAARVLSDEEALSSLSAYTVSALSEMSAVTSEIYETIDELREAIDTEIAEAIELLQERISEVDSKVDSFSAETYQNLGELEGKLDAVSSETEDVVSYVDSVSDRVDTLSGDVELLRVGISDANLRISTLSAETIEGFSVLDGRIENVSAATESVLGSVYALSGDVESFKDEFVAFSGETDSRLGFLEENISGSTEINERLDEIELVHAGAFAAFRKATGFDTNVHYNPALPSLEGFNVTEAIDYIGGYSESLEHEADSIKAGVINDEMVHAAAFARMNHSLGFNDNAEYVPSETSSGLTNMNVTEAIDYLYASNKQIVDYLGIQDTKQIVRSIMYEKLYELYKKKSLMSGMLYRITNYQATVNELEYYGEFDTRVSVVKSGAYTSMGFDVIVRAISESELDENALIALSRDKYYFRGCRLGAWQAKYCIENDTSRFDWASDDGFGVIYWLRDEYGNEAPYDFKNIVRKKNGKKYFLFNYGTEDMSMYGMASSNVIKPTVYYTSRTTNAKMSLPNITFDGSSEHGNTIASGVEELWLDGEFYDCMVAKSKNGQTLSGTNESVIFGYRVEGYNGGHETHGENGDSGNSGQPGESGDSGDSGNQGQTGEEGGDDDNGGQGGGNASGENEGGNTGNDNPVEQQEYNQSGPAWYQTNPWIQPEPW